ncbi:histidine kinase dimerization/phosphoacceptor domain -containing protein [Mucilaginibacter sp. L3T2-6]|uniref:tetratricopeptide repeat-containing sensor histidine kinase n=1 Tax=Mucilaginibacter sp. L3T2-6 TaxID=3062491 RepID=UPI002675C42E|nr:histidine kinase dimerization/phosphoacceptor domain -containing protein [Mucilaginibacter sp. L3T2-6]MDO3642104.1 tetratricopeptide repeat protein [Mucilaginibacter sp. L3T2-6]MDV6214598.1 tetratricopeptide repeat protein [Mucilaginibacter sp. L3T2-6]
MPSLKKGPLLFTSFCLLLINTLPSFSQNADTLLKRAASKTDYHIAINLAKQAFATATKTGDHTAVIKSLNFIAELYGDKRDYDSTKVYAKNALLAAEKYNIDSFKGNSWLYMGNADYGVGAFASAIEKYNKAANEYKKANKQLALGNAYLSIGVSKRKLSRYSDAVGYYMRAIDIFDRLKNTEYLSYAFQSIAVCFNELNNFDKALEYNKKALALTISVGKKSEISTSLNNIGYLFYKHKKIDSSIYYLSKSLAIIQDDKDSSELVLTLQNLGSAWRMKGEIKKAEKYISRAQHIAANYKMGDELARGNADLAEIYLAQKKYAQALSAINVTIDTAKKEKVPELLLHAYTIKYKIYKQTGDYKNALLYADIKNDLKDTIFNSARDKSITEMETKYKTVQAEKDRDAFKVKSELQRRIVTQQTKYIIVLAFAAILLAILFVIAYNNFRKKNKANERIQTLMRDLHHRVKNNLQILQGLFSMQIDNLSDENTKAALRENEARLTSMNLIHSRLYLDNTTTKIEMNDYLTKLLNHIKDSFGGYGQTEINLRIEVSNIMLEADKAVAIGLIANELTTNSFKYAFNGKGGGEIHLALQLIEKSKILLTLGDNGVGLKPGNKDKAPSFGLKLVNLMARQLNSTLVVKSDPGVFYQMEISI